jgi:hypothetical protein
MQTFKKQSFDGRSFDLDETVFIECQLKNCDLFYAGGDVEMINTKMENCKFHWRGAAKNTVWILQSLGMLKEGLQQNQNQQVNIAGQKAN